MDFQQALEIQRFRLLRLVAGLAVLLGVLSVGPVSRCFSVSICRFVGSVLSRAETAARYLVIAQARSMVARSGIEVDQREIFACLDRVLIQDDDDVSLSDCQRRLNGLRAVLRDLRRSALRLLRWIEKQNRRTLQTRQPSPCTAHLSASLRDWKLATVRIERPPD